MKKFFTKMILLFFVSMLTVGALGAMPDKDYLCFTAEKLGATVMLKKGGTPSDVILEYSTDGSNWLNFFANSTTVILANVGDKVYLRNKNEAKDVTTFSQSDADNYRFLFTSSVSVSGNIMSLIDKNVESTTIPCDYCFCNLFGGSLTLTSAADLKLPATTLAKECYSCMFIDCTALTAAPAILPATTLAKECYSSMFAFCTALETAPKLKAETLAESCYQQMFQGCKKLKSVKVGFTKWGDLSDSGATDYRATYLWLNDAGKEATNPTFECPADLDTETRDDSHVPAGWTTIRIGILTLDDNNPYNVTIDIEDIKLKYKRAFTETGKYEALYLPFSVTMTEDLLDKVTIAKIYMVSTKGSVAGGSQDAGVNVVVVKTLGEGESTMPHTPYFIRSEAGTDLEFTQEGTTLYASTTAYPGHIDCSTTMDTYDFIGTYEGKSLTPEAGKSIYVLQGGALHKVTSETDLHCNRWQMVKTP
ncbi:MAG: hypothetical protein KBS94_07675, partial [Prevotella sp.]|nr:hypothetical protein [Candidatus Equicola faecalis]